MQVGNSAQSLLLRGNNKRRVGQSLSGGPEISVAPTVPHSFPSSLPHDPSLACVVAGKSTVSECPEQASEFHSTVPGKCSDPRGGNVPLERQ